MLDRARDALRPMPPRPTLRGLGTRLYAAEARRAPLWLPACFAVGIAIYTGLDAEPPVVLLALPLLPAALVLSGQARRGGAVGLGLASALLAMALGLAAAILETRRAAAPVVPGETAETVEGRVVAVGRAASGVPRLTLTDLTVYGFDPAATPARVRLALVDPGAEAPPLGHRIRVYARLFPPGGPVEPGGFDFRYRAFFDRLGGVGYVRGAAVLDLGPDRAAGSADALALTVMRLRDGLSRWLRTQLPGPEGAFAAAILAGDRAGIMETDEEALRIANLSHLLAISGLHMGILTGLVFAAVRFGLAAVPAVALRLPTKKIAAVAALAAGAGYLALTGATVATQRAFVMVGVALLAVLLDRPAITLRALAVAALVVLAVRPSSLYDVGFQLSFAATTALVAVYEALGRRRRPRGGSLGRRALRGATVYLGALLLTSLVAGLATAPIAAFHFNRSASYGLLANLLALPAMGLWIAPMAMLAGVLAPIGLASPAVEVMGAGIAWILAVAHWVAALPGAVALVPAGPPGVLPLLAVGGLWLALWRSSWRWAGILPVAAALALWVGMPARPGLLVAPEAKVAGLLTPAGRAVTERRYQSFAVERWLRRDGDAATQEEAFARAGFVRDGSVARGTLPGGWAVAVETARQPEAEALAGLCRPRTVLVARNGPEIAGPCLYFGRNRLLRSGAIAVDIDADGSPRIATSERPGRARPWLGAQ